MTGRHFSGTVWSGAPQSGVLLARILLPPPQAEDPGALCQGSLGPSLPAVNFTAHSSAVLERIIQVLIQSVFMFAFVQVQWF